jgi:toxin CptA
MPNLLTSAAFVIAAICAGLMGYAIQRGATCTVAAMDEVVRKRGVKRLVAMAEASLWVLGGLAIAQSLDLLGKMPGGYAVTRATIVGGALLGLGAYVNKACVFGAIARLGSGEWAYVATPLGFYAGCVTSAWVFSLPAQQRLAHDSPVLRASTWLALAFAAFLLWRLGRSLFAPAPDEGAPAKAWPRNLGAELAARVWSPHVATTVIGVTFFFMFVLVGAWAYTDVLAELARGMAGNLVARCILVLALLLGAMLGGYTAGRWRNTPPSLAQVGKCLAGGLLMGWGTLLIPGGNDGLILVGMPLLWPYAWAAFAAMCVTIAFALAIERSLVGQAAEQAVH